MNDDILIVAEWIKYAQEDYECALLLAKTGNPYAPRKACYDCQQSAEKILKAYIIANGGNLVKTHDLKLLLENCVQYSSEFDSLRSFCTVLNLYIAATRYPSDTILTTSDMETALQGAYQILEFTKSRLKDMGYG
jgi:HEPN domain-containing protein